MAESRDLISLNRFETEPFFLFFADFYQSSKRRNHHHRLPRAKWFNQQSSALSTSFPSRPRRSLRFPNLFEPCFRCVSAARNTSRANPFPSKPVFVSTCARAYIYIYIYTSTWIDVASNVHERSTAQPKRITRSLLCSLDRTAGRRRQGTEGERTILARFVAVNPKLARGF